MKSIDVEGLPEPVAKAIEQVVRTFKVQLAPKVEPQALARKATAHELPRWPGKVALPGMTLIPIPSDVSTGRG